MDSLKWVQRLGNMIPVIVLARKLSPLGVLRIVGYGLLSFIFLFVTTRILQPNGVASWVGHHCDANSSTDTDTPPWSDIGHREFLEAGDAGIYVPNKLS